jgi:hypothetical protein
MLFVPIMVIGFSFLSPQGRMAVAVPVGIISNLDFINVIPKLIIFQKNNIYDKAENGWIN